MGDIDADGRDDFFTFLPPARGGDAYTVLSQGNAMGPNELRPEKVRLDDRDPFPLPPGRAAGGIACVVDGYLFVLALAVLE